MKLFNKKFLIILITLLIVVGFTVWFYLHRQANQQIQEMQQTTNGQIEEVQIQQSTTTISAPVLKTYRNKEWGFEFSYPQNWIVEENYSKNYYSKFNLKIIPANERHSKIPVVINIVLPEFADNSFRNIEKTTSEIIINGVSGIKYEYEFGGRQEIAIILPLDDLRIIIGTDNKQYYEDFFYQILTTFKFLK